MEDVETILKDWALELERTYPAKIARAKADATRDKIIGAILCGLGIWFWLAVGMETIVAYLGWVPFFIGMTRLNNGFSDGMKYIEQERLRIARLMGRQDYASVIVYKESIFKIKSRCEELNINLYERSEAEREAREAEGLYW